MEQKSKNREKQKRWHLNNPEKGKILKQNWYQRNKERVKENNKRWRERNKMNTVVEKKDKITEPKPISEPGTDSLFIILDVLRKDNRHYLWYKCVSNWTGHDWYNYKLLKQQ